MMSSRHFTPIVALLLCCVATVTSGQDNTKVLVIGGRPQADVVRSFGVAFNNNAAAYANSDKLQSVVDAGPQTHPWFFPAGSDKREGIYLGRTLVLPVESGRKWTGTGLCVTGSNVAQIGSRLIVRAQSSGISTTFNGTSLTATTDGADNNVLVIPTSTRVVHDTDKYNSFEITGGTNFVPGWYGIEAVDTENNTWTLDRDCTDGGAGSAMTGFYVPEIVQDRGYGTVVDGINFSAMGNNAADRPGGIGYHVVTSSIAEGEGQAGKLTLYGCVFDYLDTGVLLGRHMAEAYEGTRDYAGRGNDHADHLTTFRTWFRNVRTCFHHRNRQSVLHNHVAVRAMNAETVFRFDSGGKLECIGLDVSGTGDGVQRILYIGDGTDSNHTPYIVRNFSFDGGDNTASPQLVKTVRRSGAAHIVFDGGILNGGADATEPLCDVGGGHTVIINAVAWVTTPSAGCLKAVEGTSTYRARFIISNCKFGATSGTDPDPSYIVSPECGEGIIFDFINNSNGRNSLIYADGRYITDGNGGGTWVSGGPPSE